MKLPIRFAFRISCAADVSLKTQNQHEEYLGLPGDNLNLYAVMKLFQESKTLEGFEKSLNKENSKINNISHPDRIIYRSG